MIEDTDAIHETTYASFMACLNDIRDVLDKHRMEIVAGECDTGKPRLFITADDNQDEGLTGLWDDEPAGRQWLMLDEMAIVPAAWRRKAKP